MVVELAASEEDIGVYIGYTRGSKRTSGNRYAFKSYLSEIG